MALHSPFTIGKLSSQAQVYTMADINELIFVSRAFAFMEYIISHHQSGEFSAFTCTQQHLNSINKLRESFKALENCNKILTQKDIIAKIMCDGVSACVRLCVETCFAMYNINFNQNLIKY